MNKISSQCYGTKKLLAHNFTSETFPNRFHIYIKKMDRQQTWCLTAKVPHLHFERQGRLFGNTTMILCSKGTLLTCVRLVHQDLQVLLSKPGCSGAQGYSIPAAGLC